MVSVILSYWWSWPDAIKALDVRIGPCVLVGAGHRERMAMEIDFGRIEPATKNVASELGRGTMYSRSEPRPR